MIKKFRLYYETREEYNNLIYPRLDASYVFNPEIILNKSRDYYSFLPVDTTIVPLMPDFGEETIPNPITIPDFLGWTRRSPAKGDFYPTSEKLKNLMEEFNLPESQWYKAGILKKEKIISFYVLQLNIGEYKKLINFDESTFCDFNFAAMKKRNDAQIKVNKFEDLKLEREAQGWRTIGLNKAVMKPKFEHLDLFQTYDYGLLISERLKDAIEAAKITGVKITECPIEFEIAE